MSLITTENASAMGKRSAERRQQRLEELRSAVQIAVADPSLDYIQRNLSRVRIQIERINTQIDLSIEGDTKELKELTDALSRLYDIERQLSGRPLPGTLRPSRSTKPAKADVYSGPEPD